MVSPIKYLRESKEELEKVSWPSQKDTIRYSIIVIAATVLFAVLFGVTDLVFSAGIQELLNVSTSADPVTPNVQIEDIQVQPETTEPVTEEGTDTTETGGEAGSENSSEETTN